MVKYLYYTESSATGGSLSAAYATTALDQILLMYGGDRMCIHPADADYKPTETENYPTLAAAQAAYPDYTWIYLDQNAVVHTDEIAEHPADDVVYVVGHDLTGYGVESLNGNSYKLRTIPPDNYEGHAIVCLCVFAMERWNKIQSWL